MKKILILFQFFPLTIFLFVARSKGFTEAAWAAAFQMGALFALLETLILLPLLRNQMSRLIGGANLFLIIGGMSFYFEIPIVLGWLATFREAGIFVSIGVVCLLAILMTSTGIFEVRLSRNHLEKKYSYIFMLAVVAAAAWSFAWRGQTMLAGTVPFIFLIGLKFVLQKQILRQTVSM